MPGKTFVTVQSADGKSALPGKTTVIPDADAFTLDLDFGGITVSGVVLDAETEEPIAQVDLFAAPKKPGEGPIGGGRAVSGPDGRFQLELEPGAYRVSAGMAERDYAPASVEVDVGEGGAPELRLVLRRGAAILGKVLDASGRGVGGIFVTATAGVPPQMSVGSMMTQPDGSFRLSGLREEPHTVAARSDLGTFAVRTGVATGENAFSLTLRPGGRIRVQVTGQDQKPAASTSVSVVRYRGAPINVGGGSTDAQGLAELLVPAGSLELRARKDRLEGTGSVSVSEGGVASVSLVLVPIVEK